MPTTFAKRSLGQNFLQDPGIIRRIVEAVDPLPTDTIVEIGPGRGALTEPLVRSGARVVAVEKDDAMAESLRERFATSPNFALIHADALELELRSAIRSEQAVRIVANLPYNISTAILQRLIEQRQFITDMTLMLQREVVDRISAGPGDPERGFLSVLVEAHCQAEKLFDVPPSAFMPVPKVWSSVVWLTLRDALPVGLDNPALWRLVSAGFRQRRKTILNNLKAAPELFSAVNVTQLLASAGIEESRRAQTLTLNDWISLTRACQDLLHESLILSNLDEDIDHSQRR